MLIRNYTYDMGNLSGHYHSGITNPLLFIAPHRMRGYFTRPEAVEAQVSRDSFPTGTNPPYSYVLGDKGALISSTTQISGTGSLTSSVAMGRSVSATINGTGSLTAGVSLIVQVAAALTGTGALTASMTGVVSLACTLAGSGNLTASLGLLANVVANLTGSGSLSADVRGKASVSATIYVNAGTATTEELAAAVWNALAASFNTAGTMGNKMNAAGSAGDPWSTILPGSYTGSQAGAIVAQIDDILSDLDEVKGAGFDTLKHNLKKIKEAAQEAADLSA
jgi:hypothetical protein